MANRVSSLVSLPLAPVVEQPTEEPILISVETQVEVTVVTVKSASGIQTLTTE
jgi:hypothetical protein